MLANYIIPSVILVPLVFGILGVLLSTYPKVQRVISLFGSLIHFFIAFVLFELTFQNFANPEAKVFVIQVGNWVAPAGISLVVDGLAATMIFISSLIALMINIYQMNSYHRHTLTGLYHSLFHFMMMGVCGAFITGDIFNLYVFFEIFLVSSFVMTIFRGQSFQLLGGYKYLVLNLLASSGFILGLACIYNSLGTLNMAHIAKLLAAGDGNFVTELGLGFLVVTFAAKAGLMPLYSWLPASYPSLPAPILALFAGLLTKIGVYTIARVYSLFLPNYVWLQDLLVYVSLLTMLFGVLGAAIQMNIRKILSFHIISQIGYITIGIGLGSFYGYLASIVYLIHHMVVKTNLFLVAGLVQRLEGTNDLDRLGLLAKRFWPLKFLFLVPALSLAGVPPLSGFWAKWMVIQSLTTSQRWLGLFVSLLVGALTLYSMIKIWMEGFWKPNKHEYEIKPVCKSDLWIMSVPIFILCLWTIGFGLEIQTVISIGKQIATQLALPQTYITAVLPVAGEGL